MLLNIVTPGTNLKNLGQAQVVNASQFGANLIGAKKTLSPTMFDDSADTFGAPTIGEGLFPATVVNTGTFGSPKIQDNVDQTQVSNTSTFGAPTIQKAAPAVVQAKAFSASTSNASFTLDSTPTAGNWLICFWQHFNGGNIAAHSGWTAYEFVTAGGDYFQIYYRKVVGGDGTSWTAANATGGNGGGVCFEVSGLPSTWGGIGPQYEAHVVDGSSSSSIAAHACSAANTLALAYAGLVASSGTLTPHSGWTTDAHIDPAGSTQRGTIGCHALLVNNGDSSSQWSVTAAAYVDFDMCVLFLNSA
jgi:hypothetical protein